MGKDFITKNDTLIICLNGEIDQYAVAILKEKIDIEIEVTSKKNLIFDLRDVTLMDSSGIGLILGRYKLVKMLGGGVALCNASPAVKKIIDLSGITKIIPHCKNRESAENSFDKTINSERGESK